MIARPIPSSETGSVAIVVNGVEQPVKKKLELAGEGVSVAQLADRNIVTVALPETVSGGAF